MNKAQILLSAAVAAALSACAGQPLPYPRATAGLYDEQMKLQSVSHWDLLARNESARLLESLPQYATLYVMPAGEEAPPFQEAYHTLLTSSLVREGAVVMLDSAAASHHVEYGVQTVTHQRGERQRFFPGSATAFLVVGKILASTRDWTNPELVLLPLGLGADLWNLSPFTSEEITEVLITTRVHDGSRLVSSESRVYYFNPADMRHYQDEGRVLPVVGAAVP